MALPMFRGFKFDLTALKDDDLNSLKDLTGSSDKVCVVSVIGKGCIGSSCCKASFLDESTGLNMFQDSLYEETVVDSDLQCKIGGFFNPADRTIFLHLTGINDSNYFIETCKILENELQEKSFLEVWSELQTKQAKALLLLFQISHILIVVHPTATLDISYIHLFRTLDAMRQKAVPCLSELLRGFSVSQEWIQAGRPCSPRVLFVFTTCPLDLLGDTLMKSRSKSPPPIKKLEHSLEDQIYHILRKSRVITNISGNSLFAVPANQEFVYVITSEPSISDPVEFLLNQLRDHCMISKETDSVITAKSKSYMLNRRGSNCNQLSNLSTNEMPGLSYMNGNSDHSFRSFLWQHIDLALTKGFDDNVGRHPVPAYFELPSANVWFQISTKLKDWFFQEPTDSRAKGIMSTLKTMLDTDVRFSEGRCSKVLPMASAAYQEALPSHYTTEYHQRKLAQAIQIFTLQARGPAYNRYVQQLQEDCERLWKSGHQMCEELSLNGNPCINPLHRTSEDQLDNVQEGITTKNLPVMPHYSQVKLVSICDCGRRQATRDDPFDTKAANYDFYVSLHKDCCSSLERVTFSVFQPSTSESQPASNSALANQGAAEAKTHSGSSFNDLDESENFTDGAASNHLESLEGDRSQKDDVSNKIVISITDGSEASKKVTMEKMFLRQPSTTEYLPGMLHLDSRPGLLPLFPSWSLVCLGPSSLYSHNIGIQDQPGFLTSTNFLLPWDVTVKVEQKERWTSIWDSKRLPGIKSKKGGRDGSQFTVKIFIGVEYECPRGFRFMCSAPDRVLRPTGSGLVKDNANKVTGSDMPLYVLCPCRPSKPNVAQLMRIHVVTPKAPVHVTLNPRVQPAPAPCPLFYPGNSEPLKLSQSAYWVLRLPLIYQGDQGPYLPSKEPLPAEISCLRKGVYGITQIVMDK